MKKIRKIQKSQKNIIYSLALVLAPFALASSALADAGPVAPPSPFIQIGSEIAPLSGNSGLTIPGNVPGGSMGPGTINAAGYYMNGLPFAGGSRPDTPITASVTYQIGPGGDFPDPGTFLLWLDQRRIFPSIVVTANIADGVMDCVIPITPGHIDGLQLKWTNSGMNRPYFNSFTAPITAASGNGTSVTITFTKERVFGNDRVFVVGQEVHVRNCSPYNGDYTVTGASPSAGTVTYASAVTGAATITTASQVLGDFGDIDDIIILDPVTGMDLTSWAAAKIVAEARVRAAYKVILQFSGVGLDQYAVAAAGKNLGDWSGCPCLFINTANAKNGLTTGDGVSASISNGDGATCWFDHSCFFGFLTTGASTDTGGTINCYGTLFMFNVDGSRTDFGGVFIGFNVILIGNTGYGWRGNHAGECYYDYVYAHCNSVGAEATNTSSMYWMHRSDIQHNVTGCSTTFAGSGKIAGATCQNNARSQIACTGLIDATLVVSQTTATFGGSPPPYGISILTWGVVIASNGLLIGNTRDIYLQGLSMVSASGLTYGTAIGNGNVTLAVNSTGMIENIGATGRGGYSTVEVSGAGFDTLVLPPTVPDTVGIIQPAGNAGNPIVINTIDFTNLISPASITFVATNAVTGENVTINDSTLLALKAPSRYLENVRDTLVMKKIGLSLQEVAYSPNQNNRSSDTKRIRSFIAIGDASVDRTDDILVGNKTTGAAFGVSMNANMNFLGSEFMFIDAKGDAATHNVTFTPGGGAKIDGASTYVMNWNGGEVWFKYTGITNKEWTVVNTFGNSVSTGASNAFTGANTFKNIGTVYTAPTISAGVLTLDLNNGPDFNVSLNAAITSIVVNNAIAGVASSFRMNLTADGTPRTVAFTASQRIAGGATYTPTSTNAKIDSLGWYTPDGGTTWLIDILGQAY